MGENVLSRGLKSVNILRTKAVKQMEYFKPISINFDVGQVRQVLKKIPKHRYFPIVRKTSMALYGTATAIGFLWVTDWRQVCQYIPYYGSKYKRGTPRKYSIEPDN